MAYNKTHFRLIENEYDMIQNVQFSIYATYCIQLYKSLF